MDELQPQVGQPGMAGQPAMEGQPGMAGSPMALGAMPPEAMVGQGATGEQMATPEQKQELLTMIDDMRQKLGDAEATRIASQGKTENIRKEMLKRVFEILQLSGVDLEKRESVSAFLEKLRTNNPQLAEWFENSVDVLLGKEDEGVAINENEYEEPITEEGPVEDISQGI